MYALGRTVLAATAASLVALTWATCGGEAARDDPADRGPARPWSVQLHVHGSFSEGLGSIDSHSFEATDVGLDVLWWSDHDWRLTTYHTLSRFGFEEEPDEPDRAGDWTLLSESLEAKFAPEFRVAPRRVFATGYVEPSRERAYRGAGSFQISAASLSPEFRLYAASLQAPKPGFRRSLAADLALRFALWVDGAGEDGRVWVEVRLSEHAPRAEQGELRPHVVRYVLGGPPLGRAGEPQREEHVLWIPLEHAPAEWTAFEVPLTADVRNGFSFLGPGAGLDDSITGLSVGIETRGGAAVTVFVDEIEILQKRRGPSMLARQREVIDRVSADYPDLRQLQGVEISYLHPHLNEFSLDTELIDYDALARESGLLDETGAVTEERLRTYLVPRVIEQIHARGGLVSFNHPMGTDPEGRAASEKRGAILAELLEHGCYGADLLEVGYRDRAGHPLRDHLWAWDQLALRAGIRMVGIGVSDNHGGPDRWRTMANNFVSWIVAPSPEKADLVEGLRRGEVWFGDITQFDGTLELTTDGGARMGQEVVTDRASIDVAIAIDGLEATDRVIVVESGELTRFLDVEGEGEGPQSFRSTQTIELPQRPGVPSFVRIESFARDGTALVFSNPIHFLREVPAGGLEPARAAIDFAGVRSRRVERFRVEAVEAIAAEGWTGVRIAGRGDEGALVLDVSGLAGVEVELEGGLDGGSAVLANGVATLTRLDGAGRVVLKVPAR